MPNTSTSTALIEYEGIQPLQAELDSEIATRDKIAISYVVKTGVGYHGLKPGITISTISDRIGDKNLVVDASKSAESLLQELEERSKRYFEFRIDLFKFYSRHDRGFMGLFMIPMTHALLEEETIEQKFPDDVQARALMLAFNAVIRKNQYTHILHKRCLQIAFTLPIFILYLLWPALGSLPLSYLGVQLDRFLPSIMVGAGFLSLSALCFIFLLLAYLLLTRVLMTFCLSLVTTVFKHSNEASCDRIITVLTGLNSNIARLFNKLNFTDIAASQADFNMVSDDLWPGQTERVFKLSLWTARRIEHLERFWQIQLERLRVFELISDRLGNYSSIGVWLLFQIVALGVDAGRVYLDEWTSWLPALMLFLVFALASWWIGLLSRQDRFSFGIGDIRRQGFDAWAAFGKLKYYDRISSQYRNGKAEIQKEIKLRSNRDR